MSVAGATADGDWTIRAGWVVDGTGAPAVRDVRIRMRRGRIRSVAAALPPPEGEAGRLPAALDLSGYTVLPALVDSHAHLFLSGSGPPGLRRRQMEADSAFASTWIRKHLEAHLRSGIAAVRDGGDRGGWVLRFRRETTGAVRPVRIRTGGRAWHRAGRYGRFIGRAVEAGEDLADAVRRSPSPGDHVKVLQSGVNSLQAFGKETPPQFSHQELRDAVRAAAERGLGVMAHANGRDAVRIAVEAGCRSLEHGFFMGEDNLRRMADRGTWWVPTACTMEAYAAVAPPGSLEAEIARRTLDHQLGQISRARELGVPIAAGTDAGSPGVEHGASLAVEMALLVRAGFTPEEAVRCAAENGARLLDLPDMGTVSPGKRACLVAVPGGPADLPASLRHIALRIYDGVPWEEGTAERP